MYGVAEREVNVALVHGVAEPQVIVAPAHDISQSLTDVMENLGRL